ncbi:MAG: NAD(P)/FAD-dependent oxidoreductase [Candidatus Helarchaeota archaeon]
MEEETYDVVVIGAGPAGLTAGIYTKRANLSTIVFSGKSPPRLTLAHKIENYPGVSTSITGTELLNKMREQAIAQGVLIRNEDIISLYLDGTEKMVTSKTKLYKSKVVIIATGMGPRRKTLIREEELVGRGLSYCAICDGPLYKGKTVIMIGNDKETGEEALELQGMGINVLIYTNGKKLEVEEKVLTILKSKGIKIDEDSQITEVVGTQSAKGIKLKNGNIVEADGIFIVYTMPSSMLFQNAGLKLTKNNNIEVNSQMETNKKGVYAAGDVIPGYNQVSIAVGTGATAAMSAIIHIRENK